MQARVRVSLSTLILEQMEKQFAVKGPLAVDPTRSLRSSFSELGQSTDGVRQSCTAHDNILGHT
jgi:hypothetical protein